MSEKVVMLIILANELNNPSHAVGLVGMGVLGNLDGGNAGELGDNALHLPGRGGHGNTLLDLATVV